MSIINVNSPSNLLTAEENETVFTIVGHRKQSKATAVVQMFHAHPDRSQWTKFKTGVACFVKDNIKKSYYIRLIDLASKATIYEQEVYNQFAYKKDRPFFHSFPGDKFMVGLNFSDEGEAAQFSRAVDAKLHERSERKMTMKRQRDDGHVTQIGKPPVNTISEGNDPFAGGVKTKPKRPKGKKISKSDIGAPSDFRHLSHVGFDPSTGAFDSSNIDPQWKKLLDTVGVTNEQLKDKNTATFIYDFVEKHGGILEANRQLEAAKQGSGPPPPPSRGHGGGHSSRGGRGLPPPPPRGRGSGPPPPTGSVPAPPPPPPVGAPAPPPPPPVSGGSGGPPRPPPGRSAGGPPPPPSRDNKPPSALPPVSGGRGDLLASIRAGKALKTVDTSQQPSGDAGGGEDEDLDGMAGALARALQQRSNVIQQSDDSDEAEDDWEDDDDEWGSP